MSDLSINGLHESAQAFYRRLIERYPEFAGRCGLYVPTASGDETESGSLWCELICQSVTVSLVVQSTEALVSVGKEEKLFVWRAGERDGAFAEIMEYLGKVLRGEGRR